MNIQKLINWSHRMTSKTGTKPEMVPLTRDEMMEVVTSAPQLYPNLSDRGKDEVYGMSPFFTPYASEMRERSVDFPFVRIEESATIVNEAFQIRDIKDELTDTIHRRLTAYICHDDTEIKVTFKFDPWQKWKEKLRLTRWFPVKTRTIVIDGRVLYPYLKVQLPSNRHHVRFAVRS